MLDPKLQFERDYAIYSDAIFRHLYYRIQDREKALELTQEVFARFWQYIASGKEVENVKAFLYRSAKNAFINEIRTDKTTTSLDALTESGFEITYTGNDAATLVDQKEVIERMQSLEQPYRDAVVMRYVDGMQVKEIAKIVGKRENTVSVWIKRGLDKIRKSYE